MANMQVLLLTATLLLSLSACHAKTSPPHVLLISVDGLHRSDLAKWVALKRSSTLAQLAKTGVTFSGASIDGITDSFPGVLALTTGGNIAAHGVYYDDSYDRSLYAPGTNCTNGKPNGSPGAEIVFDESIDIDNSKLNAGGAANGAGSIDPKMLPLDSSCKPVYPHSFVRVNTIFEVATAGGLYTAWADKHPAYDLLNGPSGKGIADLYTPEINSQYPPGASTDYTSNPNYTMVYDKTHVQAALNWIKGLDHTGKNKTKVPNLFGFNMQTVSVTQKVTAGGYTSASGDFAPNMLAAMKFVDDQLGLVVTGLRKAGIFPTTTIMITAKHGQAPIDHNTVNRINGKNLTNALKAAGAPAAQITSDDVALIWLQDSSKVGVAAAALQANASALDIQKVISGNDLVTQGLVSSVTDSRAPDLIVQVVPGVIYTGKPKGAEHGGLNPDDQNVALLVSGAGLKQKKGQTISTPVFTRQVAPTIAKLLGLDPSALQAVKKQGTAVLPGIF